MQSYPFCFLLPNKKYKKYRQISKKLHFRPLWYIIFPILINYEWIKAVFCRNYWKHNKSMCCKGCFFSYYIYNVRETCLEFVSHLGCIMFLSRGFLQVEMFPFMGRLCSLFVCILLNMSSSSKQAFKRTGGRTCADAQASGNKAYTWQFHTSARCALHFILPARNISFFQRVSFRAGRRTEGVMKWLEREWLFLNTNSPWTFSSA